MGFSVRLSDIIEAIEFQSDEIIVLFKQKTGEIVTLTEDDIEAAETQDSLEEYPEWQYKNIKTARGFLDQEKDFIGLPTKYDVNEYHIMEKFILSIKDRENSDALYRAIKGKGAFLRFEDGIIRFDIEDEWYKYREDAIKQVAINWCELNNIQFKDE